MTRHMSYVYIITINWYLVSAQHSIQVFSNRETAVSKQTQVTVDSEGGTDRTSPTFLLFRHNDIVCNPFCQNKKVPISSLLHSLACETGPFQHFQCRNLERFSEDELFALKIVMYFVYQIKLVTIILRGYDSMPLVSAYIYMFVCMDAGVIFSNNVHVQSYTRFFIPF